MDEPTSALDPISTAKIEELIVERQEERTTALSLLPLPGFSAATFGVPGNGQSAPVVA